MLKQFLTVGVLCAVSLFVAGCGFFSSPLPPYQQTELTAEGHRLAFSQNKPMGCMLVGEKEGLASVGKTSGATIELLRQSARNDLINKSAYLAQVGSSKRMVVYQSSETWRCNVEGNEVPCQINTATKNFSSVRVGGEIYECKF